MNKINKNESGFSTVEGLLIVLIVAIVGFVGWYVLQSRNNANGAYKSSTSALTGAKPSSSKESTNNTSQAADPYKDWKTYTSKFGFSFKYPSTATIDDNTANANSIDDQHGPNSVDVFIYKDGYTKANCPVTNPAQFPDCLAKVNFTLSVDTSAKGVLVNSTTLELQKTAQLVIDSYQKKK